jgi:hypothetical protein
MEFVYRVDPATGQGEVDIRGEVVVEDLLKLMQAAWSDPAYASVERSLWNFEHAWTAMRMEDLMQLAPWISANKAGRGAKTIAIVAPDDVVFGVGRMFNALQPGMGWTISVFRDRSAALAWLEDKAAG